MSFLSIPRIIWAYPELHFHIFEKINPIALLIIILLLLSLLMAAIYFKRLFLRIPLIILLCLVGLTLIGYIFLWQYSGYYINQPDILADTPSRILSGNDIPIFCAIKDADKFPLRLVKVKAEMTYKDGAKKYYEPENFTNKNIYSFFWSNVFYLKPRKNYTGPVSINVTFIIKINNEQKIIKNDNFPGLSHKPFQVNITNYTLPKFPQWYYIDLHYHSFYTRNQVEFGAPLNVSAEMAKIAGLDFLAVTDHSFDMDDVEQSTVINDPALRKWEAQKEEIEKINSSSGNFKLIQGEEVSVGNAAGHNVHSLAIGIKNIIVGNGDGDEDRMNRNPDYSIPEVISMVKRDGGVYMAAHPKGEGSWRALFFLNRDNWAMVDYEHDGLSGLEAWNGKDITASPKDEFILAKEDWKNLLLSGRKIFLFAGNDAHGDFNRHRAVETPTWSLEESDDQYLGYVKTAVYIKDNFSQANMIQALKNGKAVITNGPLVVFDITNESGQKAMMGESISAQEPKLNIHALSIPDYGELSEIKIIKGDLTTKKEKIFHTFYEESLGERFKFDYLQFPLPSNQRYYIRLEATSLSETGIYHCFTNSIWVNFQTAD